MTNIIFGTTVIAAVVGLILYYDFRYRRHWTGYTYGYPLRGFDGQLFFTFDDGPARYGKVLKGDHDGQPIADPAVRKLVRDEVPDYDFSRTSTENLLDLLHRHDVKAIFFLCGQSIESCPGAAVTIMRMVSEGHYLGNHSLSHAYARKQALPDMLDDFGRNHNLIKAVSGEEVKLFRPPHGDWEPDFTRLFLAHPPLRNYLFPIFWNLFREWALKTPLELGQLDSRMNDLRGACRDGQGKILLLHDTYLSAVLLTARILKSASAMGYAIANPADLVSAAARETEAFKRWPFVYYLRNLCRRIALKLGLAGHTGHHTNYRMEQ